MNNYNTFTIIATVIFCLIVVNSIAAQSLIQKIDSVNAMPHDRIVANLQKSLDIFSENMKNAQSIQYKYGTAKALEQLGKVYYLSGEYDKSTECNLKAVKFFEQLNSNSDLATLYGNFGYQLKRRNLQKAMHYMALGIKLGEKNDLTYNLCGLYDNYGVLHEMNNSLDSAQYFYQKALNLKTAFSDTIGIPYSLNNLAGISAMQGNYSEAFKLLQRSDEYRNKEKGNYGRIENLIFYGEIYFRMEKLDSAITKFNQCLTISDTLDQSYSIRYCFEQLSKLYEQKKDYRNAFLNQRKYSAYKDSVLNIQTNSKIAELEIDYETEKKDRQIAEKNLKIRKRTDQLLLLAGIILLLASLSLWIYRSQKLRSERIQRELEYKNQLQQLELEKKLADEKVRISRELHDNIGSQLTFIVSSMDNLCYAEKEGKVLDKLTSLGTFGRNTLKELRNTIWAMKQEGADLSHLILKLNELKQQVKSNIDNLNVQITNSVINPIALSSAQMLNLYRIVQEAVQNVIKYAEASVVEIIFTETDNGFSMHIQDNGKGFSADISTYGNGLNNMKYRCEESGGKFEVKSLQKGTSIFCEFYIDMNDQ